MSRPGWEDRAACRDYPPETFFLITYQAARHDVKAAKAICRSCPVIADCLTWALDNPDRAGDGIWGGLTPPELRRARRTSNERTAA